MRLTPVRELYVHVATRLQQRPFYLDDSCSLNKLRRDLSNDTKNTFLDQLVAELQNKISGPASPCDLNYSNVLNSTRQELSNDTSNIFIALAVPELNPIFSAHSIFTKITTIPNRRQILYEILTKAFENLLVVKFTILFFWSTNIIKYIVCYKVQLLLLKYFNP